MKQKKPDIRISARVTKREQQRVSALAEKCGLSQSEYIKQRALGYEPRTVLPDVFFDFYNKLCELCNTVEITPETESRLLSLIDEIHATLLLPEKKTVKQIKSEIEVIDKWLPPDSGPLKTG